VLRGSFSRRGHRDKAGDIGQTAGTLPTAPRNCQARIVTVREGDECHVKLTARDLLATLISGAVVVPFIGYSACAAS